MKNKLFILALAAIALQATPVMADDHGKGKGGKKGKMFEKHDTNGDGQISQDEFLAQAKLKFAAKDTNSDGFITKEEGKAAHEAKREKRKDRRADRGLNE